MRTCKKCNTKQKNEEFRYYEVSERWSRWCLTCRDEQRIRSAAYLLDNPERRAANSASTRAWVLRNPELSRAYTRRWVEEQKERGRRDPAFEIERRRKISETQKRWRDNLDDEALAAVKVREAAASKRYRARVLARAREDKVLECEQ